MSLTFTKLTTSLSPNYFLILFKRKIGEKIKIKKIKKIKKTKKSTVYTLAEVNYEGILRIRLRYQLDKVSQFIK
jgi:hypothetical protein